MHDPIITSFSLFGCVTKYEFSGVGCVSVGSLKRIDFLSKLANMIILRGERVVLEITVSLSLFQIVLLRERERESV